jgi:hypothetical protein
VVALVLNADAEWCPFSPGFTLPMNRQTIGIITKADLVAEHKITQIGEWLRQSGAEHLLSPARKPVRVSLRSSLFFNPRSTHVPNNNGNQRR